MVITEGRAPFTEWPQTAHPCATSPSLPSQFHQQAPPCCPFCTHHTALETPSRPSCPTGPVDARLCGKPQLPPWSPSLSVLSLHRPGSAPGWSGSPSRKHPPTSWAPRSGFTFYSTKPKILTFSSAAPSAPAQRDWEEEVTVDVSILSMCPGQELWSQEWQQSHQPSVLTTLRTGLHVARRPGLCGQEASCAGYQFTQNTDVIGDTPKTTSPLLGTCIYWKHSLPP